MSNSIIKLFNDSGEALDIETESVRMYYFVLLDHTRDLLVQCYGVF